MSLLLQLHFNTEPPSLSLPLSLPPTALQHAGKHMEDSIVASYTALLVGCLCQGSQVRTHTQQQLFSPLLL